ncbi:MAG: (d)CMP kinase [Gammaproteobacteria bacterium]
MTTQKEPLVDVPVLAIDGPAAAGKGTLSRMLAYQLGWHLLDSGAIYRSLALLGQQNNLSEQDWRAHLDLCVALIDQHKPVFHIGADQVRIEMCGTDRTAEIRSEAMGRKAAYLAQHMAVRDQLLQIQRSYRIAPGLIADGRDMATRVFKDAQMAVYVTASVEVRAQRRLAELQPHAGSDKLHDLVEALRKRDHLDTARAASPLRQAVGARVLDTTDLTPDQACACVMDWIG